MLLVKSPTLFLHPAFVNLDITGKKFNGINGLIMVNINNVNNGLKTP